MKSCRSDIVVPALIVTLLVAGMMGICHTEPVGGVSSPQKPGVAVVVHSDAVMRQDDAPEQLSMTYAAWRSATPHLIATADQLFEAFRAAGMPAGDASRLAAAWVTCESPVRDATGHYYGANLFAIGDAGKADGAGQFHREWWGAAMDRIDYHTIAGAAALAEHIRLESIRQGRPPLFAWSCVK